MMDDATLLRHYAETRDEAAFSELVQRHLDGVYSIARRRVGGDAHLAEDVAQQVFLELARQAKRLAAHPVLAGWLFTTTRNAAANVVRGERRRKAHEQEAHTMHEALSKGPAEADWNRLAPLIEQAVDRLGEGDRVAVLLRFVERRTFGEIGAALRVSEDGARKRVDRALEKLRGILGRSGVNSSAAALAGALTTHAVTAAPSGLAATVAGTALAGAAAGSGVLSFLAFMSMTKIKVGASAGVILAATVGIVSLQTKNARLERETAELRRQNEEAARSQKENVRVVTGRPSPANPAALSVDVGPARGSAMAPTDAAARSPGEMRPIGTLQNRGRATPEAAWETLFWALQARDYRTLAQVMALEPADRRLVETLWARVPEVRAQGRIANAEELFAVSWLNHNGRRFSRMRIAKATTFDADNAEVVSEGQRPEAQGADRMSMGFRRTAEGWQWLVPTTQAEHTVGEAMHDLREFLKPAP